VLRAFFDFAIAKTAGEQAGLGLSSKIGFRQMIVCKKAIFFDYFPLIESLPSFRVMLFV
jgi:hypothetical protein